MGERLTLPDAEGRPVDLGRVGRVTKVDADLIRDFCAAGVVPVIPSLAIDSDGKWLNVNADTAAAAVAAQLGAEKLVLLTDTPGILKDRRDPASLLRHLDTETCGELVKTKDAPETADSSTDDVESGFDAPAPAANPLPAPLPPAA